MDIGHSSFLTWHLLDFMHHHYLYCLSQVSITFVLCNDLDRAAPKSLANFTAAANFYLLMTAPMTSVFAFSSTSPRSSLSGEMAIYQVALTAQLPLYTAVATISAKISLLL